jgi:DNA-binding transcriptional ArsR family regulator
MEIENLWKDVFDIILERKINEMILPEIWKTIDSVYEPTEMHKIIRVFLQTEGKLTLTDVARKCNFTTYSIRVNSRYRRAYVGRVRKHVEILTKKGFLLDMRMGKKVFYSLNRDSSIVKIFLRLFSAQNVQ